MPFKDILLVLITYPQATDTSEIQEAVSFAVALDARISALACVLQVRAPSQYLMSDAFVGALVASEREKSSEADLTTNQADLLVMGAYGHSRVREFILGGVTRSMLSNPPMPILLSH